MKVKGVVAVTLYLDKSPSKSEWEALCKAVVLLDAEVDDTYVTCSKCGAIAGSVGDLQAQHDSTDSTCPKEEA